MKVIPLPASAEEMDSLLRSYAYEIPDAVIRAINSRPDLLRHAGPRIGEPLDVLSGIVVAAATRASYSERVKWFESVDRSRMSRLLRGLAPGTAGAKGVRRKVPDRFGARRQRGGV